MNGKGVFFSMISAVGLLVVFLSGWCEGSVWNVATDGSGDFSTIQQSLNAAMNGDEIIVALGVYSGPGNRDLNFNNKAILLRSADPNDDTTIQSTVIDCFDSGGVRHRAFLFENGETLSTVVSGFTIINGIADVKYIDGTDREVGGAVYCATSSPTIQRCYFSENEAFDGAAIFCFEGSSPVIEKCLFTNNISEEAAGAVSCRRGNPVLRECSFENNSAYEGGALAVLDSSPTIEKCSFTTNIASIGGALWAMGGSLVTVSHSQFTSNRAENWGESKGGAALIIGGASAAFYQCEFTGNSTSPDTTGGITPGNGGGAISFTEADASTIDHCSFEANSSNDDGGAISCYSSGLLITCSYFTRNIAVDSGGAIYARVESSPTLRNTLFTANQGYYGGAAMWRDNSEMTIENCTFCGNYGVFGGALRPSVNSTGNMRNCILRGNYPTQIKLVAGAIFNATYCDIQEGYSGTGNINVNPLFVREGHWVDPSNPLLIVTPDTPGALWHEGDRPLQPAVGRWEPATKQWISDLQSSACIDAGDAASDWTAELWPHGQQINMGRYGGTAEASVSLSTAGNTADFNNDGAVDMLDIEQFCHAWLAREYLMPEDINRNGQVDLSDFTIFATYWLEGT